MRYNLITILGPTAVGKTRLAALLADRFNGAVISADSRQVYKGIDIGTGKDLADYNVDGKIVESYLIDLIEPEKEYNLFSFMRNFHLAFDKICGNGKIPFLAGGTGLYLHSVLKDYNLTKVEFDTGRYEELNRLSEKVKGFQVVEMNAGQMVEDVRLSVNGKVPVEFLGRMGRIIPSIDEILLALEANYAGVL